MKEDKNTEAYFLHVDESVNTLEGLGEPIDNKIVVRMVLRSLLMRFDSKFSVLE